LSNVRHLFISVAGDLLPRWQEAFPLAQAWRTADLQTGSGEFDLVWLRLQPGLDIGMQIRGIRQRFSGMAFVVLSDAHSDNEALAAFAGAARGYCNSHAAPAILQQVGMVVHQGGIWIGESLMQRLVAQTDNLVAAPSNVNDHRVDSLTPRELEVAQAVAAGHSDREIATRLGITERTVKAHVSAILEKLEVRDRLQLALLLKARDFA
jgi:DNA-binding NarL/FixJ family response regulator